jgi:hypothetical protein
MKTKITWRLSILALVSVLMLLRCANPEDEVTPPDEPGKGELTPAEADALLGKLSFAASAKVTGALPSVPNTERVRTESKDTIYSMPGLALPIRLYHPGAKIKGWYISVINSSFYYDVPVEETEKGDSVTIIFPQIPPDNTNSDAPYDMPLKIVPYDESKQPVDIIERQLSVEKPNANTCGLLTQPGDNMFEWIWNCSYTVDPNNKRTFFNYPHKKAITEANPTGCCNTQAACPALVCDPNTKVCQWVYNAQVNMVQSYGIEHEFCSFYSDGKYERTTQETNKSFDPIATDWCNKVPAYIHQTIDVVYKGNHTYQPASPNISFTNTTSECDPPDPLGLCGFSLLGGEVKVGCNLLVIVRDRLNIEFTKSYKAFTRHPGKITKEDAAIIYSLRYP